jgi:hypothetical protein
MKQEELDNQKNVTELTIAPDGRVFAFGTSRPVLEILEALRPEDRRVRALLIHVRALDGGTGASPVRLNKHGRGARAMAETAQEVTP